MPVIADVDQLLADLDESGRVRFVFSDAQHPVDTDALRAFNDVIAHPDVEAWFLPNEDHLGSSHPHPDVLSKAREDFGAMILTAEPPTSGPVRRRTVVTFGATAGRDFWVVRTCVQRERRHELTG